MVKKVELFHTFFHWHFISRNLTMVYFLVYFCSSNHWYITKINSNNISFLVGWFLELYWFLKKGRICLPICFQHINVHLFNYHLARFGGKSVQNKKNPHYHRQLRHFLKIKINSFFYRLVVRLWKEDEYEGESEGAHAAVEEEGDGRVAVRHVSANAKKGEKGVH